MATPATSAGFANHLAPGIIANAGAELKSGGAFYTEFWNMKSSKHAYDDVLASAGIPIATRKGEIDPIDTVSPLEGDTKRVTFEEWAIGFEVSRVAWEDDRLTSMGSALRSAANGIAQSLRERVEIEAHRPFNAEGFDGATFTVLPDSSGLFATSHLPVTGGEAAAQSNRVDIDFGVSTYRDALTTFEKIVNDRGIRTPGLTKPAKLIGGVDLRYVFQEVVQNPTRPDSGNEVRNVTRGMVTPTNTPYITDADSWFIQGNQHNMDFYWRSRPRFDAFDDRSRRVAIFVGIERFKVFPWRWQGMHGSQGS